MSEGDRHMPDREGLAAEYVLGTLPYAERLAAEALIASDAAFAALVADWQERLAPLNDAYGAQTPPADVFARIESRLFASAPRRSRWRWHLAAALGAAATALVLIFYVPATQQGPLLTAELRAEGQPLVIAAAYDPATHMLRLDHMAGPAAAEGKDYELWVIHEGTAPVSMGVIGVSAAMPMDMPPPGTVLAVSLEPDGGSPTGAPTGPVLVSALLRDL